MSFYGFPLSISEEERKKLNFRAEVKEFTAFNRLVIGLSKDRGFSARGYFKTKGDGMVELVWIQRRLVFKLEGYFDFCYIAADASESGTQTHVYLFGEGDPCCDIKYRVTEKSRLVV